MKKVAKKKPVSKGPYYAKLVPTTWLDPLLTGPKAVVGAPPYNCKDIERLLWHVAERIKTAPNRRPS